jgi:hypothetical protein
VWRPQTKAGKYNRTVCRIGGAISGESGVEYLGTQRPSAMLSTRMIYSKRIVSGSHSGSGLSDSRLLDPLLAIECMHESVKAHLGSCSRRKTRNYVCKYILRVLVDSTGRSKAFVPIILCRMISYGMYLAILVPYCRRTLVDHEVISDLRTSPCNRLLQSNRFS